MALLRWFRRPTRRRHSFYGGDHDGCFSFGNGGWGGCASSVPDHHRWLPPAPAAPVAAATTAVSFPAAAVAKVDDPQVFLTTVVRSPSAPTDHSSCFPFGGCAGASFSPGATLRKDLHSTPCAAYLPHGWCWGILFPYQASSEWLFCEAWLLDLPI